VVRPPDEHDEENDSIGKGLRSMTALLATQMFYRYW